MGAPMSKQRQSSFELLRILSMVLIVLAHMAGHGKFAIRAAGVNLYIAQFFECGGKFWSSVLVVLGAYFCITRGVRFRSIFHIGFSAACISLGCFLLHTDAISGQADAL